MKVSISQREREKYVDLHPHPRTTHHLPQTIFPLRPSHRKMTLSRSQLNKFQNTQHKRFRASCTDWSGECVSSVCASLYLQFTSNQPTWWIETQRYKSECITDTDTEKLCVWRSINCVYKLKKDSHSQFVLLFSALFYTFFRQFILLLFFFCFFHLSSALSSFILSAASHTEPTLVSLCMWAGQWRWVRMECMAQWRLILRIVQSLSLYYCYQ